MTRTLFYYLISFYACITLYLYFFDHSYIFPHASSSYQDNSRVIKIVTQNHTTISAVYLPFKNGRFTVLVSHGNYEDLGQLMPFLKQFNAQGYAIFAYDYSGYGTSTGTPSEQQSYADINAAYDYLTKELHIPPQKIVAYGRSLGAAVAIDLATRKPLAGLIIQSPFLTAYRTITQIPLFLFDKFDNIHKIKKIQCPLLVIHGKRDKEIPFWQGKKIFDEAGGEKYFFAVNNAGHSNVAQTGGDAYWRAINQFIKSLTS